MRPEPFTSVRRKIKVIVVVDHIHSTLPVCIQIYLCKYKTLPRLIFTYHTYIAHIPLRTLIPLIKSVKGQIAKSPLVLTK